MTPKFAEAASVLQDSRATLLRLLERLDEDALDRRPADGSWSVGEVAHHVAVVERGVGRMLLRRIRDALPSLGRDPHPEASILNALERVPAALRAERRVAPDFTAPTPGLTREDLMQALADSRASVVAAMELAGDRDLTSILHPHPFFGPLDAYEWVVFCLLHERRHTAQVEAMLAAARDSMGPRG